MIEKIYHLSTCTTCKRILKDCNILVEANIQDLKEQHITDEDLDRLYEIVGSYEALINKRAVIYRELGIKDKNLEDHEYRHWILHHYTMLKRPIVVVDGRAYVGNSKKTVAELTNHLNG